MEKSAVNAFKSEIAEILNGEKDFLKDKRLIEILPAVIEELFEQKKDRIAEKFIGIMGNAIMNSKSELQSAIIKAVSNIGKNLTAHRRYDIMLKLSYKLTHWIKLESSVTPIYEDISFHLQNFAYILLCNRHYEECDHILDTFNLIYKGKLLKNKDVRDFSGRILKGIGTDEILKPLLKEFQTDKENERWNATRRLIQLGVASTEPLLNLLRESQDRHERSRILRVISGIGTAALPCLMTQIREEGPWYYIRNLLLLFGKIGNKSHIGILKPFLEHSDLRVQREALKSIYYIGGDESEEIILSLLTFADDRLKIDIVGILGELRNDNAIPLLLDLLKSSLTTTSYPSCELAEKICKSLGDIGAEEAIPLLSEIIKSSFYPIFSEAEREAQDTEQTGKLEKNQDLYKVKAAAASALAIIKGKKEKHAEGNIMIFHQPQNSQDALNKKMSLSDDPEHLERWSDFYNTLTTEESNAFYHSLKEGKSREDCIIYKQGDPNHRLYFIEKGKLVLAYDQDGEEIWIKTLTPGDIAGINSFFDNSVCTTSMITISDVIIKFLEKNSFFELKEKFPEFESKLRKYSLQFENIQDILDQYGMERRSYQRIPLSGKISVWFLNNSGNPEGKAYRGDILDVSSGGLSLLLKLPCDIAQQFLNHKINLKFLLVGDNSHQEVDKNGIVVAVRDRIAEHYSIHIKFSEPLLQYSLIRSGDFKIGLSNTGLVVQKDTFLVSEI